MIGTRCRLVHVQNGREHVSSVILGADEVADHLHAEACLHQAAGWAVYEEPGELVVALRPGVRREVYARRFDPFSDITEQGGSTMTTGKCPYCGSERYAQEDGAVICDRCGATFLTEDNTQDPRTFPATTVIHERLEDLRVELRAERISYEELAELQSLTDHIAPGDVELLEAAGVDEEEARNAGRL